jgi:hypothetical protein
MSNGENAGLDVPLDKRAALCNNHYMARAKKEHTMTELLRKAIADSGSIRAVFTATGVTRQSMMKFVRGEQSLRLDIADRLAEHFGIEVRPARKAKKGRK